MNCEHQWIYAKGEESCRLCGAKRDNQPIPSPFSVATLMHGLKREKQHNVSDLLRQVLEKKKARHIICISFNDVRVVNGVPAEFQSLDVDSNIVGAEKLAETLLTIADILRSHRQGNNGKMGV